MDIMDIMMAKALSGGGGGGGTGESDLFVVTFTGTYPQTGIGDYTDVTADKTYAEARAAYDAGKLVIFKLNMGEGVLNYSCIAYLDDPNMLGGIAWWVVSNQGDASTFMMAATRYWLDAEGAYLAEFKATS